MRRLHLRIALVCAVVVGAVSLLAAKRLGQQVITKTDLEVIQGRWEGTLGGEKVLMTIKGSEMTLMPELRFLEQFALHAAGSAITPERATIRLNPKTTPKSIDFVGPKGQVVPGIYRLEQGRFTFCTPKHGDPRPKAVHAPEDGGSSCTFTRPVR